VIDLLRELLALPPGGSTIADGIDLLHAVVIGTAMLGALVVALVALGFVRRHRAHGRDLTAPTVHWLTPRWAEVLLVGGVSGLFLGWWLLGVRQYDHMRDPPPGSLQIYVVAKQWMFEFAYPDGRTTADVVYVPAGRRVVLVMTSRDVIHSLYVPAFRTKYDVLPDRYTMLWFQAPAPGDFELLCAEFCGTGHSTMRGTVRVLDPATYQAWLSGDEAPARTAMPLDPGPDQELHAGLPARPPTMAEQGRAVAAAKGCLRCHTTDGSPHIAPSFAGLYGRPVPLADGGAVVADEAYLTRSMMDPEAERVAGYPPVMPSYRGELDPAEVAALVELVVSLRDRERWQSPAERPPGPSYPPAAAPGRPEYLEYPVPPPAGGSP
jgi:cytochrome c oxidase subunit 2